MDVKNMDPEAVALFKGSLAERTRKLPVPLVHTGRVLQVLISVVFVGKHLSTAFTSVTFCRLCQTQGWKCPEGVLTSVPPLPHLKEDSKQL